MRRLNYRVIAPVLAAVNGLVLARAETGISVQVKGSAKANSLDLFGFFCELRKRSSLWLMALTFGMTFHGGAQSYLDTIVFGNTASEAAHAFFGPNTFITTNTAVSPSQTARRGRTNNPVSIYGGSLTFQLAVDPARRNYFTVKLWGSDEPNGLSQDADMGRLYLYVPASNFVASATNNYQVGYRHEGDYGQLNTAGYKPPFPNRFFYATTILPLWMTQGRTNLTLTIQPSGRLYGLGSGGPPSGNYQFNMFTSSRGIYQAYSHTDPVLNPVGETQGTAPTTSTRPTTGSTAGVATLSSGGTYWNDINSSFNALLSKNPTNFTTTDAINFALGYWATNFPTVYSNAAVITKVRQVLDFYATSYYDNPSGSVKGGGNEGWGGRFGNLGWAIETLLPKLTNILDVTTNYGGGGTLTRREAWGEMLLASRDFGRFNRADRSLANQSLIANQSIYWANRGLLALTNVNAFAETNAQRYLKEAIGIEPWLGNDTAAGGHTYSFGTNYYMVTPKGLSREWGYVGYGYGEMQTYAANFYAWTTNPVFLTQCVKMVRARVNFRRPQIDLTGGTYRAMESVSLLAWRGVQESDSQYAADICYADRNLTGNGMRCAAVTMDTNLIGYAKQMLNDGQFFYWTQYGGLSYNGLKVFEDYQKIAAAADSGVRLPFTTNTMPDFAWADEENGIVAIKRGNERLWLSTYWQAGKWTGLNAVGRFLYETNTFARYGTLEVTPIYTPSGTFVYRPNFVDLPYKTIYTPPDNLTNAYYGERNPIAAGDPLVNDNDPFAGKANFWSCRYGNFLIGINRSYTASYELKTPSDFVSATNLVTGLLMSGIITVAPQSTVVLYLTNATNGYLLPMTPLVVNAVGKSTPKIDLDWNPASGATGYIVKRSSASGGPYTPIANVAGTNYADTGVTSGNVYYYVITATNAYGMNAYDSMPVHASAGLPLPWLNVDVGSPYLPGSADYVQGAFSVTGGGIDIGSTSDSFHYVYQPMTNDYGSIIVRLTSLNSGPADVKVGVMMRASTNANSAAAVLMYDSTGGFHSVRFACRTGTGSSMAYSWNGPYISGAPVWFKLQRSGGTTYTGFYSDDGANWTAVGTNTFSMTGTVLVGLPVCIRYSAQYCTAVFDNVSVTGLWPPMPGTPSPLIGVAGDSSALLSWSAAVNAAGYNLKRGSAVSGPFTILATNFPGLAFTNTGLANGALYYFVVSGTNEFGESTNSTAVGVRPVSAVPPQLGLAVVANQMQFNWPTSHVGWKLQAQTNSLNSGIGTNWSTLSNSTGTNQMSLPIVGTNGSVFFRLIYP